MLVDVLELLPHMMFLLLCGVFCKGLRFIRYEIMLFKSSQLMQQQVLMNKVNGVCNASAVMGCGPLVLQVRGYSIGYSLPFLFALILLVGSGLF